MTTLSLIQNPVNQSQIKLFNPQNQDRPHLPLLVYLPGMDGTGQLFRDQIPKLAPHFNLRCLSIPAQDMSNWGQLTLKTTNCLKRELNQTGQNKLYLCGESFGGCLAISVAVNSPQLMAGMTIVNPASSFNQQPLLSWGINLTRWIPEWLHRNSAIGLLPFLAELSRLSLKNRRALLRAMKSLPQEVVSWRLSLLRDFALNPDQCKNFVQPTLIIASNSDRLLPSVKEASILVNLFPNSAIEVLPYSGHACLLETEVSLADILVKHRFLQIAQTTKI